MTRVRAEDNLVSYSEVACTGKMKLGCRMGAHLCEGMDVFFSACSIATKCLRSRQAFAARGCSRWILAALSAVWLAGCGSDGGTQPDTPVPQVPVTGSIAGRVTVEGEGLAGVTVSAGGATTSTGSAGAYRLDNLPGGTHAVSISGYPSDVDFPSTTASVTISSAGQTVTVDFAGTYIRMSAITGIVSIGGGGAAGLTMTLEGTETKTARTGDAGEYAFENLRAGPYVVRISGFDAEAVSFDRTSVDVVLGVGESATANFNGVSLAAEREALIALVDATGGTWADALGWSADKPVSEWGGVTTDSTGAVTGLDLSGVGMEGELPPELGNLTRLKVLDASGNKLTGSIPKEVVNLFKTDMGSLQSVNLSDNALEGNVNRLLVPGDTSLVSPLVSPPDSIAGAAGASGPKLERLDLSGNRLSGELPPEVGGFPNLEVLNLGDNDLTGPIPPELGGLASLEVLLLHDNSLTGPVPPELGSLLNLEWLDLEGNDLTGPIPPELGSLSKLESLDFSQNDLTGPIPPELAGLSSLEWLDLGWNHLGGSMPAELGRLSQLRSLRVDHNQDLVGALPGSFVNLVNLARFWFDGTSLCAPEDPVFRAWMEAVEASNTAEWATVRGSYCDRGTSEVLLRDDFATRASVENWTLGNSRTSAGVDNGLLYLTPTEEGWAALVYQAFDDGVSATDWRVTARIAREGDDVRMIIWLFMDHDVYQDYRFEIGSGYDVADRETNYRFFAWNDNRDGPGEGGWVYFSDVGHGFADAVNDGVVEFNEVDYSIIDGALTMNVNGTTVAGPAVLQRHLPTDIVGIGLASASAGDRAYATSRFDWVELNGELLRGAVVGGEVDGAHVPPEVADRIRRLEARLAAGDVKEERIPRGSR